MDNIKRQNLLHALKLDGERLICIAGRPGMDDALKSARAIGCPETVRQLKQLAKRRGVPVIYTLQLPHHIEYRKNKRPRLSDLKGGGIHKQQADAVCLLYRTGYYTPLEQPQEAEIIIAQNKHGSRGTALLKWQASFAKFSELP